MGNDNIDNLFNDLKGKFDIEKTPEGHQKRFLYKLNNQNNVSVRQLNWWKPLSVAASIAILITVGYFSLLQGKTSTGLASVSPEMKKTQTFFNTAIEKELNTLDTFNGPKVKAMAEDAIKQIKILEDDYKILETDLSESGNDKRVIYAMISNFQKRIDLLQNVIKKIEEVKELNNKTHENIL